MIIVLHQMHNLRVEGIKDHERPTLHERCIKIALAKKGLSQTDGAGLEKSLNATKEREDDSSKQKMPSLRRQGHTLTSNKLCFFWLFFGGVVESETNLSHLFVSLYDVVLTFHDGKK